MNRFQTQIRIPVEVPPDFAEVTRGQPVRAQFPTTQCGLELRYALRLYGSGRLGSQSEPIPAPQRVGSVFVYERATVRCTALRVERLQEITEEDAKAMGVRPEFEISFNDVGLGTLPRVEYRLGFKHLWDRKQTTKWADNPFVWVLTVERTKP